MSFGAQQLIDSDRRLRVLVIDDHELVHWGFRTMLGRQPWVERCLAAATRKDALDLARRWEPHVALIDLFLGTESGAEFCRELRAASPATNVLLISGAGRISQHAAAAVGASGFIGKNMKAADITMAVRMVGLGMTLFTPLRDQTAPTLSPRERDVLQLIASGATNREIATQLYLSPYTVKQHSSAVYRKLGVRNRAEAVQRAQRLGWLD